MLNHCFTIFIAPKSIAYITLVAAEVCNFSFDLKFLSAVVTFMLIQYRVFRCRYFLALCRTVDLWPTFYWFLVNSLSAVFAELSYHCFYFLITLPVAI